MKTVRLNTFETNSSSCHVVTICGQKQLERMKNYEVICTHDFYYDEHESITAVVPDKEFVTLEDALTKVKEYFKDFVPNPAREYNSKVVTFVTKLSAEELKDIISGNKKLDNSIDSWDIKDIFREVFGDCHWYDEHDDCNPFNDDGTYSKPDYSDIEGPITHISCEVSC